MEQKTTTKPSVFDTLNGINCNEHTERKNGLTYLSWAWAWQMVKKHYPTATYTIYETPDGRPYFDDGRTCWVKTGVTIEGQEHIEYLPIMDLRNNSIPVEKVTSMDMNKAIQRSLTKAAARHGLGLYIYAGEDLPADEAEAKKAEAEEKKRRAPKPAATKSAARHGLGLYIYAGEDLPADEAEAKKAEAEEKKRRAPKPAATKSAAPAEPDPNDLLPGGKTYALIVKKYAEGTTSKSGEDYRTVWTRMANPSADLLERFDYDVATYRMDHNLQPAF